MKKAMAQPLDLDVDTPDLVRQVAATVSTIEDETVAAFRHSVSGITKHERQVLAEAKRLGAKLNNDSSLSAPGRLRLEKALHNRVEDAAVLFRQRPADFYPQTVTRGSGLFVGKDLEQEELFANRIAYLNFYAVEVVRGLTQLSERADFAMLFEPVNRDREDAAEDFRRLLDTLGKELLGIPTDPNWYRNFLSMAELQMAAVTDKLKMTAIGEAIPSEMQPFDQVASIALEAEVRHKFATALKKGVWFAGRQCGFAPTEAVPLLLMEGVDRRREVPHIEARFGLAWGPNVVPTNEYISLPIDDEWMDRDGGMFNYFSGSGYQSFAGNHGEAGLLPGHIVAQRENDTGDDLDDDEDFDFGEEGLGHSTDASIEPGEVESFWLLGTARFEALNRAYDLSEHEPEADRALALEAMSKDWGINGREGVGF